VVSDGVRAGAAPAGRYGEVGETFTRSVTLEAAAISAFAANIGDTNPLHHDAEAAARTRFGGLIACGPHTSSLLMAVTADVFSRRGAALGLDFRMRFRRAVPAGATLTLRWTITAIDFNPSMQGEVIALEGDARDAAGERYLSAEGLVLVRESL
jgi:3-hydroxybutyryl-CoA dehydratase